MRLNTSSKPTLDISDISSSCDTARHAHDDVDGCCTSWDDSLAVKGVAAAICAMDAMAAIAAVGEMA